MVTLEVGTTPRAATNRHRHTEWNSVEILTQENIYARKYIWITKQGGRRGSKNLQWFAKQTLICYDQQAKLQCNAKLAKEHTRSPAIPQGMPCRSCTGVVSSLTLPKWYLATYGDLHIADHMSFLERKNCFWLSDGDKSPFCRWIFVFHFFLISICPSSLIKLLKETLWISKEHSSFSFLWNLSLIYRIVWRNCLWKGWNFTKNVWAHLCFCFQWLLFLLLLLLLLLAKSWKVHKSLKLTNFFNFLI